MVCLNKNITFEKLKLQNNLIKNVTSDIENKFYLQGLKIDEKSKLELINNNINNIKKIIEESIKNSFSNDNFIYVNMDKNLCTHKYKKGKNDGNFCCKKITKNGNKSKYVCTKHNPDHIPTKKAKIVKKAKIYNDGIINTITRDDKVILCKKNNKNKVFKKKLKNKIIVHGIIDFKKIMNKLLT